MKSTPQAPAAASPPGWGIHPFPIPAPSGATADIHSRLGPLENGPFSCATGPLGSEEPARDPGPPESSFCPGCTPALPVARDLGGGCPFLLPLPSPRPPSPSPSINENQEAGEWGLERAIPFLFMGLRRSSRGKECGLSPEARSRPLGGGWVPAGPGL